MAWCLLNANSCHQTEFSRIINCQDASQLTPACKEEPRILSGKRKNSHQRQERTLCGEPTGMQLRGWGPRGLPLRPNEGTTGVWAVMPAPSGVEKYPEMRARGRSIGGGPRRCLHCCLSFIANSWPVQLPLLSEPQFPHL